MIWSRYERTSPRSTRRYSATPLRSAHWQQKRVRAIRTVCTALNVSSLFCASRRVLFGTLSVGMQRTADSIRRDTATVRSNVAAFVNRATAATGERVLVRGEQCRVNSVTRALHCIAAHEATLRLRIQLHTSGTASSSLKATMCPSPSHLHFRRRKPAQYHIGRYVCTRTRWHRPPADRLIEAWMCSDKDVAMPQVSHMANPVTRPAAAASGHAAAAAPSALDSAGRTTSATYSHDTVTLPSDTSNQVDVLGNSACRSSFARTNAALSALPTLSFCSFLPPPARSTTPRLGPSVFFLLYVFMYLRCSGIQRPSCPPVQSERTQWRIRRERGRSGVHVGMREGARSRAGERAM